MNRRRARNQPSRSAAPPPKASKPAKPADAAPQLPTGRLWLFRLTAMLLAPPLLLLALDLGLRVAGFGYPSSFFLTRKINGREMLTDNPQFGWRFFGRDMARSSYPFIVSKEKAPGTTRIFVFGESAAYGDPVPDFSVARLLEALFSLRFPERRFEIVDTGMTGINSHVVLSIARDCAREQGDIWSVYMGNNEVVGPFGSGTVFGPKAPPRALVRLSIAFKATRLGQVLDSISHKLQKRSARDSVWGGMGMFLKNHVRADDPRMAAVYANFQANLDDIIRLGLDHGAQVIVSTMARNLRDCAPFASDHRPNLSTGDASRWDDAYYQALAAERAGNLSSAIEFMRQANTIDDSFADLHFRWGQCALAMSNQPEALREFTTACDDDTLRFRSDTRLNEIIRQTAANFQSRGVRLVDGQGALAAASQNGIVGNDMLYEHVHLNFEGNYHLALALAQQIIPTNTIWPSIADCARRLTFTDYNRSEAYQEILQREADPPYTSQLNHADIMRQIEAKCEALLPARAPEALVQDTADCKKAVAAWPKDWFLNENLARFQEKTGDVSGAVDSFKHVTELLPQNDDGWKAYGIALSHAARLDDAKAALNESLRLHPDNPQTLEVLAELAMAQKKTDEARTYYERILKIQPFYGPAHLGLGKILDAAGRHDEAAVEFHKSMEARVNTPGSFDAMAKFFFERGDYGNAASNFMDSLRIDPSDPETHVNLGRTLEKLKLWDDAQAQYAEAVRLDTNFAVAHFLLGLAEGRKGNDEKAMEEFNNAARLDPDLPEAHVNLGVSLYRLHRDAESRQQFDIVLRHDPTNQTALSILRHLDERAAKH